MGKVYEFYTQVRPLVLRGSLTLLVNILPDYDVPAIQKEALCKSILVVPKFSKIKTHHGGETS